MTRLPLLQPDELDADQSAVYESIIGGRRAAGPQHFLLRDEDGSLTGPFNALLHAPRVGAHVSRLGEAIRFETTLTDRERELAILAVAAARRASYEWYAHERVGRACGLTDEEIDSVRRGEGHVFRERREVTAHAVAATLAAGRALDDTTYQRAAAALTDRELVELVALVGYYVMLATLLDAFGVSVPEGDDPFAGLGAT
jgi:4-carboxymuconolactone decarboxylase